MPLATANLTPSRTRRSPRWERKVQKRLPIQLQAIATQVETAFAMTGPSCSTSGDSTVSRSRLNTVTSTTTPTRPTAPKRASWATSGRMMMIRRRR